MREALHYAKHSHLSPITLVDDGVIITNECLAKVSTDDGPEIASNGSHLIMFERVSFTNGTKYSNQREAIRKGTSSATIQD